MKKIYFLKILLVFAFIAFSFKSLTAQNVDHWEMVVASSDTWNYFPGTA